MISKTAWGAMRKPLIFVARVHGSPSCSPAVALGFESASDDDAVCVTCPTTYQRWKLPKTSVQTHVPWGHHVIVPTHSTRPGCHAWTTVTV